MRLTVGFENSAAICVDVQNSPTEVLRIYGAVAKISQSAQP
jgi:hypothetical protein